MPALHSEMTMTAKRFAGMNETAWREALGRKYEIPQAQARDLVTELFNALSEEKSRADKLDAEIEQLSGDRYAEQVRALLGADESQMDTQFKKFEGVLDALRTSRTATIRSQPEMPSEYPAFSKWFANLDAALYSVGPDDHDAAWLGWQARAFAPAQVQEPPFKDGAPESPAVNTAPQGEPPSQRDV